MIDTIVLLLKQNSFTITEPNKFSPSASWILNSPEKSFNGITSKQNPKKQELAHGIYKPRLTLSKRVSANRKIEIFLKVELSLPKLLFGNNFNELQYKDFKQLCKKLVAILADMGVATTKKEICDAEVFAIHYSKNIELTDGSTPYHYINKIKEANSKMSLDVNQTDYRNDGHSYRWHCNSYEVVFYDKIRDLEQAKKSSRRAIEKDNELQLDLFEIFKKRERLEYLRIEVRLNKRKKIKQLFEKLNLQSNELTFKKLFKPAISKKILLHYLDQIESRRTILSDYKSKDDKLFLAKLIVENSSLSPSKVMKIYGLKKALEIFNLRELRGMFSKATQRNWYRLMDDLKDFNLPAAPSPFDVIRKSLAEFKAVRFEIK